MVYGLSTMDSPLLSHIICGTHEANTCEEKHDGNDAYNGKGSVSAAMIDNRYASKDEAYDA
jgi:hypothetical protein